MLLFVLLLVFEELLYASLFAARHILAHIWLKSAVLRLWVRLLSSLLVKLSLSTAFPSKEASIVVRGLLEISLPLQLINVVRRDQRLGRLIVASDFLFN